MFRNKRKDNQSVLAFESSTKHDYDVGPVGGELDVRSAEATHENIVISELGKQIVNALEESQTDFLTVHYFMRHFNLPEALVRAELKAMTPDIVRPAITFHGEYDDWYRLTSRGMTPVEKRNRIKALITFQSLRNSDY